MPYCVCQIINGEANICLKVFFSFIVLQVDTYVYYNTYFFNYQVLMSCGCK